ncbi:MAG: hypothetical protein M1377_01765 [Deltaproteobacteria bacterium]|nr:hypothetical protein [Deltaproteobacteria bacterium]
MIAENCGGEYSYGIGRLAELPGFGSRSPAEESDEGFSVVTIRRVQRYPAAANTNLSLSGQ